MCTFVIQTRILEVISKKRTYRGADKINTKGNNQVVVLNEIISNTIVVEIEAILSLDFWSRKSFVGGIR